MSSVHSFASLPHLKLSSLCVFLVLIFSFSFSSMLYLQDVNTHVRFFLCPLLSVLFPAWLLAVVKTSILSLFWLELHSPPPLLNQLMETSYLSTFSVSKLQLLCKPFCSYCYSDLCFAFR